MRIVNLLFACLLWLGLASTSYAQVYGDQNEVLMSSAPVAGLYLDTSTPTPTWKATMTITTTYWWDGGIGGGLEVTGAGAQLISTTGAYVGNNWGLAYTYAFNQTGEVHATYTYGYDDDWNGEMDEELELTDTYFVIGGPIKFVSSSRTQQREERANVTGTQPVILDYFGNSTQDESRAQFQRTFSQPGGVTYTWNSSGPIAVDGSNTGASATYYATGGSGRAGAAPSLTFRKVYKTQTYSVGDSTVAAEKAISCHAPVDVRHYSGPPDNVVTEQTATSRTEQFLLYVVSNIGDPQREVRFQEWYPDLYYINGQTFDLNNDGIQDTGVPPGTTTNQTLNTYFYSGSHDLGQAHPGYLYMAKTIDYNGASFPPPVTNIRVYQHLRLGEAQTGSLLARYQIDLSVTDIARVKF